MTIVDYKTNGEISANGHSISFVSNDQEIGRLSIKSNESSWGGPYEENGKELFSLDFDLKNTFLVYDQSGKKLYEIVYDQKGASAKISNSDNVQTYHLNPIGDDMYGHVIFPWLLLVRWIMEKFKGTPVLDPQTVRIFDPSGNFAFEVKHKDANAFGTLDDQKIDRRLGLALLAIYSYPEWGALALMQ